jgi:Fur family ferric uptake transcriptional regulator
MSCYQEHTQELREAGHRITPQRLMVMEVLFHTGGHLTAEDIHALVRAQYPCVDMSTVYRTLQVLKEQGLAAELQVRDGPTEYEAAATGTHHHAVCAACGARLELPPDILAPIRERLLQEYGFQAELAHVAIPGLCSACTEGDRGHAAA